MPTITEKKIEKAAWQLEEIIKQAKRKLFELETLANARAIQEGGFSEFKAARNLLKSVKRTR